MPHKRLKGIRRTDEAWRRLQMEIRKTKKKVKPREVLRELTKIGPEASVQPMSSSRNLRIVKLKGLWKGLKVDDRDIEAAKKCLFKHVSA